MGTWMILTDLPQPESENRGVDAFRLEDGQLLPPPCAMITAFWVKPNCGNASLTRNLRSMESCCSPVETSHIQGFESFGEEDLKHGNG
jgi:hypothetical protein